MVEITVCGVSEDVLACLEAQAKANWRSLEGEIRDALVRHTRHARVDAFRERTAQLCSLSANRPQADSVALLRKDRGCRVGGTNATGSSADCGCRASCGGSLAYGASPARRTKIGRTTSSEPPVRPTTSWRRSRSGSATCCLWRRGCRSINDKTASPSPPPLDLLVPRRQRFNVPFYLLRVGERRVVCCWRIVSAHVS